jgi:hypothetical protein
MHPFQAWVGLANFDIEASYGGTDGDGTFLKNRFERSILDLVIPFEFFVPISSTIWLTNIPETTTYKI